MKRAASHWVVLLAVWAEGCNGSRSAGRVVGCVLIDGKPLPGGYLMFRPADPRGELVTVVVDESGRYSATVPAGEVFVSVDNRELAPRVLHRTRGPAILPKGLTTEAREKLGRAGATSPASTVECDRRPGRYVRIPDRYYLPETSGLRLIVQPGEQQHDVLLTSRH